MNAVAYTPLRLMGRCADGFERDSGALYHAVPDNAYRAVCGQAYGRRSAGWSPTAGAAVTCPRCLRKIARATGSQS